MNKTETKNSTTKRLTLTRRTLPTVTTDELRLVAGGAQFRSQVAAPGHRASSRVPDRACKTPKTTCSG